MNLRLLRQPAIDETLLGQFSIDGTPECVSLERASLAIPPGRYRVRLTVSGRATRGELWSPDPDHRLPLLEDVPERTGIRIHAGNVPGDVKGCIALGRISPGPTEAIVHSQTTVEAFMDRLEAAESRGEETWLDVVAAAEPTPQAA